MLLDKMLLDAPDSAVLLEWVSLQNDSRTWN